MMPRFAISFHEGAAEGDHYDLMLEREDVLKTWRLPGTRFRPPQPAVSIRDHRKLYLDFEGGLSDGRGKVTLWDRGMYSAEIWEDELIVVALAGKRLKTRLRLMRAAGGWTVEEPA